MHPLVDARNSRMLIAAGFPSWDPRRDSLSRLLWFIKSAFKRFELDKLSDGVVANEESWRCVACLFNLSLSFYCSRLNERFVQALSIQSAPVRQAGLAVRERLKQPVDALWTPCRRPRVGE